MARRVLVLSNEDLADANEVPPAIRPLIDEAEEIYVVAPTLTTWMATTTNTPRRRERAPRTHRGCRPRSRRKVYALCGYLIPIWRVR